MGMREGLGIGMEEEGTEGALLHSNLCSIVSSLKIVQYRFGISHGLASL
jgi:hypothetical protein